MGLHRFSKDNHLGRPFTNTERVRRYRSRHPEPQRKANQRYRERHPERVLQQAREGNRRFYERHPERVAERSRLYYEENPAKILERNRRWQKQNPEKWAELSRIAGQNRRSRICGNGGSLKVAEWLALKAKYNNHCLACGKSERQLKRLGRKLVLDHVLPLAKKGRNDIANIQPLCHGLGGCNNRKGKRHIDYRPRRSAAHSKP
jgi:hypothetical protein